MKFGSTHQVEFRYAGRLGRIEATKKQDSDD